MVQQFIQRIDQWDTEVFWKIFGDIHRKAQKRFFYTLSRSADSYSCAAMAAAWALLNPSTLPYVFAGLIAFTMELSLYYLIKKNIKRPRPFRKVGVQCLIAPPDEFSFPSGHTGAAFLMAFLITSAFPVLLVPAFTWACLVGFSRVYLGVHYPTDVMAGMVLGLISAQCGLWAIHSIL